ncbi:MAG TPA: CoA-binding protein [Kineosporiaceae bacterium]
MVAIKDAAAEFLQARRIAVTGVSRHPKGHGSNAVVHGLRKRGYQVFPVNPNADEVEGDRCYHTLAEIPGGVDAVVVGTRAELAEATVKECADLGIPRVWLHRSMGAGSASPAAAEYGRAHGVQIINGGCPLMFGADADPGHRVMRFVCRLTGAVPRQV